MSSSSMSIPLYGGMTRNISCSYLLVYEEVYTIHVCDTCTPYSGAI